jgi:uncharacterized protein (TIGR02391 family)
VANKNIVRHEKILRPAIAFLLREEDAGRRIPTQVNSRRRPRAKDRATKSVSEKLRRKSDLTGDAGELATKGLSLGQVGIPFFAFISLATETDKSEQSGLINLFVGMFGAFRNVTAHGPRITWKMTEQDALDLMTLVSLLHRRLDMAIRTERKS